MLKLQQLEIGYHGKSLVHVPDVTIEPGELVCLLGRNGQGKSTLLRTLAGLQPAVAGDLLLDNRPLSSWTAADRSREIAIVVTERLTMAGLTAIELVELGRQPYTGWSGSLTETDRHIAQQALSLVGGSHLRRRMLDTLSDGERQRVMIARALAQQPRIMLLDEITAFLDLPSRVTIIDTLRVIARERQIAIVLSSHDLELSLHTADRLWLLTGDGKFIDGAPEDVALSGEIGHAFDQKNLRFSLTTGRFETVAGDQRRVGVQSISDRHDWLLRALERCGFTAVPWAAGLPLLICEVAPGRWSVNGGEAVPSIRMLMSELRAAFAES